METSSDQPTAISGLKRNVLDLRHVIVMAIAVMAPAWVILGGGALWYLLRTKPQEVKRACSLFATGESEEVTVKKENQPNVVSKESSS